jgi:ABC-type nickel/cobalt efflux system permease component RcnA
MNAFAVLLAAAAAGVDPLAPDSGFFNFSSTEGKVILGAIIVVLLVFGGWIIYALAVPKKKRHHHHRRHHHHDDEQEEGETVERAESSEALGDETSPENVDSEGHHEHRHRRRRHRKREHRPRNPTLAETGGLPPIRTEAPPGP